MELLPCLRLHQIHVPEVPLRFDPCVLVFEISLKLLIVTVIKGERYIMSGYCESHDAAT